MLNFTMKLAGCYDKVASNNCEPKKIDQNRHFKRNFFEKVHVLVDRL